jgi:hypothetical protein
MRTLLFGLALLVAAHGSALAAKDTGKDSGKKAKKATPAADPNEIVGKSHGGKVWIVTGAAPSGEGAELDKWLSSHPSAGEVTKKPNEERWPITFIAVFKKAPAKGPVTVEFVDKKEPGTLVDQFSPPTVAESVVFQEPYDLETNNGFNKGHTYIIKVGQIIKGKFVSYATGEVSLK